MNYLIDADVALIENDDMNRKYYDWFLEWSKKNSYYIVSQHTFDELYMSIGKDLLYNAQVIYANGGRTVYIQGRLIEYGDALTEDPDRIAVSIPEPITYYGNNISFGHAVTASGESVCRVRNWKEAWKHLKEEELCA